LFGLKKIKENFNLWEKLALLLLSPSIDGVLIHEIIICKIPKENPLNFPHFSIPEFPYRDSLITLV
jgi:hypothetical protein